MNYSREDILAQIAATRNRLDMQQGRELVLADTPNFDLLGREVYKDEKIKREKDISRDLDHEERIVTASPSFGERRQEDSQMQEVNSTKDASTSSRPNLEITGISVQHCITDAGVKVTVNIQTYEDSLRGSIAPLTAELKRSRRMNEVKKIYQPDSYEFQQLYIEALAELKTLPAGERTNICVGRLHQRGQRSAWVADMFMIGYFKNNVIDKIYLNANNQEFEILLDQPLSPQQTKLYHASGIYGEIKNGRTAPTLATIKRIKL